MTTINFPLDADLTKAVEDFDLKSEVTKILMQSKDKNAAITAWKYGEWLVYDGTDLTKPDDETSVRNCFCTFTKADVYDVAATSKLDIIMGPHYAMTKNFDAQGSYIAGTMLVVKLVSSYGVLTPQTSDDDATVIVGMALNDPTQNADGYLEYLAF
jgi:hypothetical protein